MTMPFIADLIYTATDNVGSFIWTLGGFGLVANVVATVAAYL